MKVFKMVNLNFNEIELKELNSLLRYSEFYIKDNIKEYNKFVGNKEIDKLKLMNKKHLKNNLQFQDKIKTILIDRI